MLIKSRPESKVSKGFTLIELMIVMSIVALLMGMVGPLAINSVDKARAKQEMLTLKNWLKKVSARAFYTGNKHDVSFNGKTIELYIENSELPFESVDFDSLFFQPQRIQFSINGFVNQHTLEGTFRDKPMVLDLYHWLNEEQVISNHRGTLYVDKATQ